MKKLVLEKNLSTTQSIKIKNILVSKPQKSLTPSRSMFAIKSLKPRPLTQADHTSNKIGESSISLN